MPADDVQLIIDRMRETNRRLAELDALDAEYAAGGVAPPVARDQLMAERAADPLAGMGDYGWQAEAPPGPRSVQQTLWGLGDAALGVVSSVGRVAVSGVSLLGGALGGHDEIMAEETAAFGQSVAELVGAPQAYEAGRSWGKKIAPPETAYAAEAGKWEIQPSLFPPLGQPPQTEEEYWERFIAHMGGAMVARAALLRALRLPPEPPRAGLPARTPVSVRTGVPGAGARPTPAQLHVLAGRAQAGDVLAKDYLLKLTRGTSAEGAGMFHHGGLPQKPPGGLPQKPPGGVPANVPPTGAGAGATAAAATRRTPGYAPIRSAAAVRSGCGCG